MDTVQVEYVGRKAKQPDTVAGTKLVWVGAGSVHSVPAAAWVKMAKHPDVWRVVETPAKATMAAGATLGDVEAPEAEPADEAPPAATQSAEPAAEPVVEPEANPAPAAKRKPGRPAGSGKKKAA